ncbi:MAG: 3-phosphoshikimate 1-carboxyvinyltransferase [Chloroflexota bacterium]|nr:3-phosphoshikimate 1-carboxyvinyltransferase [Chloroflexota bacterium]
MRWRVRPRTIGGEIEVPGDKSIAHRALMVGALAEGETRVIGLPDGEDVHSTQRCLATCGVHFDHNHDYVSIRAPEAMTEPSQPLDAGNSGTTMRLLAGILAGRPFESTLVGDASLSRRPMERVAEPLRQMGARVESHEGFPPLWITGGELAPLQYVSPIPSAQVKSAILFAGLSAPGMTSVTEPAPSRDHTERMLAATGIDIQRRNGTVHISGGRKPRAFVIVIPGDISAAAFFLVAGALTGGRVTVRNVGVNPTRAGILEALDRMGASIEIRGRREEMGEPVADITVTGPVTKSIVIEGGEVPALIDEIPLLALLATRPNGRSVIRGASELRVKESDRLAATARVLGALGARVRELPDGLIVDGGAILKGEAIESGGDHRIAMMAAVAGTVALGQTVIGDAEACVVSYPGFAVALRALGGSIDEV